MRDFFKFVTAISSAAFIYILAEMWDEEDEERRKQEERRRNY